MLNTFGSSTLSLSGSEVEYNTYVFVYWFYINKITNMLLSVTFLIKVEVNIYSIKDIFIIVYVFNFMFL